MSYLLGFLMGVVVATAGMVFAQQSGGWLDQNGQMGQYDLFQHGGGVIHDGRGNFQYFSTQPMPGLNQRNPC